MNAITTPVAMRALSLVASIAITSLIVSVHAADLETLGAHDVAVAGSHALARSTAVQQPGRVALAANAIR